MAAIERAFETARARNARIVMPEMSEARVAEAAARIEREGLGRPVDLAETTQAQVAALVDARGMKEAMAGACCPSRYTRRRRWWRLARRM